MFKGFLYYSSYIAVGASSPTPTADGEGSAQVITDKDSSNNYNFIPVNLSMRELPDEGGVAGVLAKEYIWKLYVHLIPSLVSQQLSII